MSSFWLIAGMFLLLIITFSSAINMPLIKLFMIMANWQMPHSSDIKLSGFVFQCLFIPYQTKMNIVVSHFSICFAVLNKSTITYN